ncbi:MAG: type IV secretion system protein [Sphingomicrobium sp.]
MSICTAQSATTGFAGSLTRFVDCQAQGFAASAYGALATPGSTSSILLTGLVTILVALIGYNLMLGQAPSLRSGVTTLAKVAIVVTLATSWQAYSTLVYNVVVEGPDQVVAEVGRPAAVPGSDGSLTAHIDAADAALVLLSTLGPGQVTYEQQKFSGGQPPFIGFDVFALGMSRIIFLLGAVGGLIIVRVVAALMLALGPLFLAFLIFANTRSLFEGWVRVLAGAAIGSIAVSLVLGLELALLEPWLADVVARRLAGESMVGMPAELVVVMTLFALILIGAVAASAKLAGAFRLAPPNLVAKAESLFVQSRSQSDRLTVASATGQERTRAAAVAESLMMMQRHERTLAAAASGRGVRPGGALLTTAEARSMVTAAPVGGRARTSGRRTGARASASAARRDSN